jgi:hypothetical protein
VRRSSIWYWHFASEYLSWETPLKTYRCAHISEGVPTQLGAPNAPKT